MNPLRLLGPFPPPYGGVAVHLVRLLEALRGKGLAAEGLSQGGVPDGVTHVRRVGVFDLVRRSPIHYHTDEGNARWMMLFGAAWRLLGVPYVVTVHSFRDRPEFRRRSWTRQLRNAYRGARAVVAISEDVRADLVDRLALDPASITVIGSDLPISRWEYAAPLPAALPERWRTAAVRVVVNAGRLVRYNGQDLYGMDLVAQAVEGLPDDVATALVVGEIVDQELLAFLHDAASRNPQLMIVRNLDGPLLPVVAHAHIVVRPTRTEGGRSLTLTEALELGRWAIGSDAVERPDGTRLFESGSVEALRQVLHDVVLEVQHDRMPERVQAPAYSVDELLAVYRRSFS